MKIEEMIAAKRADCSGCEACANICPKGAIEMTRDADRTLHTVRTMRRDLPRAELQGNRN